VEAPGHERGREERGEDSERDPNRAAPKAFVSHRSLLLKFAPENASVGFAKIHRTLADTVSPVNRESGTICNADIALATAHTVC
jgi:hypothetical protein